MKYARHVHGERLVRWFQRLNIMSFALIVVLVLLHGRSFGSLSTYEAYNYRNPNVVQWTMLQPLLQEDVYEAKRTIYGKVTKGLLKEERHRAIAAGVCVEEGVDVVADKEAGYTLEGYVPYAFFLHLHDCLKSVTGHQNFENFFMFATNYKHFDPPIPANATRLFTFTEFATERNPFAIVYRKYMDKVEAEHLKTPHNPLRVPMPVPYGLMWPAFSSFYQSKAFAQLQKPIAVVAGKYTTEWGEPPVNYIATRERLEPIINVLLEHGYLIIYNRPNVFLEGDSGVQTILDAHDFELIKEQYQGRDVIILQDIEAALIPPDLDMKRKTTAKNSLLLQIYASTSLFITTQVSLSETHI